MTRENKALTMVNKVLLMLNKQKLRHNSITNFVGHNK